MGELQCISFQDGKVVSVGEHDDTVMACWMADTAIRLSGGLAWSFAGAEQDKPQVTEVQGIPVLSGKKKAVEPTGPVPERDESFDPFGLREYGGSSNPLLTYPGIAKP
jgi:hypothetical protein